MKNKKNINEFVNKSIQGDTLKILKLLSKIKI